MKPRELSAWVAENWPAVRDNPKTTETALRAMSDILVGKMRRRYPWADPDEIRSTIQLGAWRALLAFDPAKGAFFPYAHQYAWRMCAYMAVEMRVPLVWDRPATRSRLGLTVQNSAAWYIRECRGERGHTSLDAFYRDDDASTTWHDLTASAAPSPEDWLVVNERLEALEDALRFFSITVRDRWRAFVLNGTTERELAQSLGVCRNRVTQLKAEWHQYQAGDATVKAKFITRHIGSAKRLASFTGVSVDATIRDFQETLDRLRPFVRNTPAPVKTPMSMTARRQSFTRRTPKIVALAAAGKSHREIAAELQVSRHVVARTLKSSIALDLARAANDPK